MDIELYEKAGDLKSYLEKDNVKKLLADALPKWLTIDRFLRVVFTATLENSKLLDCSRESILSCIMKCAQLGLEPVLGRAYLIPYENNKKIGGRWIKVTECKLEIGYQGLLDLCRRSNNIIDVYAKVVYEKDLLPPNQFKMEYGLEPKLYHKPCWDADCGDAIGAYSVFKYRDGHKSFLFMPIHKINKRRDASQAYQRAIKNPNDKKAQETPWIKWADEQREKTVLKRHAKTQQLSIECLEAIQIDNNAEMLKIDNFDLGYDKPPSPINIPSATCLDDDFVTIFGEENQTDLIKFVDEITKIRDMSASQVKTEAIKEPEKFLEAFAAYNEKNKKPKKKKSVTIASVNQAEHKDRDIELDNILYEINSYPDSAITAALGELEIESLDMLTTESANKLLDILISNDN